MTDDGAAREDVRTFIARHFSVGDLISVCAVLVGLGAGWAKLDNVARDVQGLKQESSQRSTTDSRVAALEYRAASAERDRVELKNDLSKRLDGIDQKLDALIRDRSR